MQYFLIIFVFSFLCQKKYPLSETVIYLKRFILAYNISAQFVDGVYR